jgi:hypothetical protein
VLQHLLKYPNSSEPSHYQSAKDAFTRFPKKLTQTVCMHIFLRHFTTYTALKIPHGMSKDTSI